MKTLPASFDPNIASKIKARPFFRRPRFGKQKQKFPTGSFFFIKLTGPFKRERFLGFGLCSLWCCEKKYPRKVTNLG